MDEGKIYYKVDRDNRVVVCKITGCEDIARARIAKYVPHFDSIRDWGSLRIKDTYVGVAKCSPDDEFDEERGKKLALTRAKCKRGKAINNVLIRVINKLYREMVVLAKHGIHNLPDEVKN